MNEVTFSIKEVKEIFSISYATVLQWLGKYVDGKYTGKFKHAYKKDGNVYIPAKDVKKEIDRIKERTIVNG